MSLITLARNLTTPPFSNETPYNFTLFLPVRTYPLPLFSNLFPYLYSQLPIFLSRSTRSSSRKEER